MKEIGIRDDQWLSILVISPVEGEWDASIAPAKMPEGWKQIPAEQFENEYGIYLKQDDNGEPIMNPKKETYWVREQNTTAREFIESLETSVSLEKALFYLGQYTGKGNHYVSFPDANIPDDVDPIEFAEYLAEQDNETFDLNENGDFFFDSPEKEKYREILSRGEFSIFIFWDSPVLTGANISFSCYPGEVFLRSVYEHGPFYSLEEAEEYIFQAEKNELDSWYDEGGETCFWHYSPSGKECPPPDFSKYGYRAVEGPSDYWWIETI